MTALIPESCWKNIRPSEIKTGFRNNHCLPLLQTKFELKQRRCSPVLPKAVGRSPRKILQFWAKYSRRMWQVIPAQEVKDGERGSSKIKKWDIFVLQRIKDHRPWNIDKPVSKGNTQEREIELGESCRMQTNYSILFHSKRKEKRERNGEKKKKRKETRKTILERFHTCPSESKEKQRVTIAMTVTAEAPVTKYNTGSRNVGGGSVGDSMYRGTFQKLGRGRKSKAIND
ncbi:hypothetical protein WN51_11952 [Melipona quadrifasciata]|uniref:Uncharacterized protein n=1 Tax=Melipona quadrifasciata TaxID=166423 RepID=A0A0N0BHH0_9HYME|nr:hypothetical protein WN51_11952 [Melipona quadrifasciata]